MKRALLFVVTTLAAAALWTEIAPAVAVTQPLAFNHAKHTAGLTCVGCHAGVMTGARGDASVRGGLRQVPRLGTGVGQPGLVGRDPKGRRAAAGCRRRGCPST